MSVLGGLAYARNGRRAPKLLLHFVRGAFRTENVLRFLQHLVRHVRGRVVLVWDNLSAHKSGPVKQWLTAHPRVGVVHLPPYAPELNAVEALWAGLQGTQLANACDGDLHPLRARVLIAKRNLRRRPRLFRSFLAKAGLSL